MKDWLGDFVKAGDTVRVTLHKGEYWWGTETAKVEKVTAKKIAVQRRGKKGLSYFSPENVEKRKDG